MTKNEVIVVKLKEGSTPPSGFTFIRNLRGKDIYQKKVQNISKKNIDDLVDLFGNMNVEVLPEDEISRLMGSMSLGGSRRRRKKRRTRRKTSRRTRRR
jgi:hypothetical protein